MQFLQGNVKILQPEGKTAVFSELEMWHSAV